MVNDEDDLLELTEEEKNDPGFGKARYIPRYDHKLGVVDAKKIKTLNDFEELGMKHPLLSTLENS